jgi:hypothetical protein
MTQQDKDSLEEHSDIQPINININVDGRGILVMYGRIRDKALSDAWAEMSNAILQFGDKFDGNVAMQVLKKMRDDNKQVKLKNIVMKTKQEEKKPSDSNFKPDSNGAGKLKNSQEGKGTE